MHFSTPESDPLAKTAQTVALRAIAARRTVAAISAARRSPRVSGPVGGVLPVVTVGGSLVQVQLSRSDDSDPAHRATQQHSV
jgi:hypothetical protein